MVDERTIEQALDQALADVGLPFLGERIRGKVRDIYRHDDQLIPITTDRLSAFDRILALVPFSCA